MITLDAIKQAADKAEMTLIDALTMMQAGAAETKDEETLSRLCEIKWQLLGIDDPKPEYSATVDYGLGADVIFNGKVLWVTGVNSIKP